MRALDETSEAQQAGDTFVPDRVAFRSESWNDAGVRSQDLARSRCAGDFSEPVHSNFRPAFSARTCRPTCAPPPKSAARSPPARPSARPPTAAPPPCPPLTRTPPLGPAPRRLMRREPRAPWRSTAARRPAARNSGVTTRARRPVMTRTPGSSTRGATARACSSPAALRAAGRGRCARPAG